MNDLQTSPPPRQRMVVEAGACLTSRRHAFSHCALESKDCGFDFQSSIKLHLKGGHASKCLHKADEIAVGHCHHTGHESDQPPLTICSNAKYACPEGMRFQPGRGSDWCTIVGDIASGSLSRYGKCVDEETGDSTCLWDRHACPESLNWKPANQLGTEDECPCSKVRTGACHRRYDDGKDHFYCAVSADGCAGDDKAKFLTHKALEWQGMECYLCTDTAINRLLMSNPNKSVDKVPHLLSSLLAGIGLFAMLMVASVSLFVWRRRQERNVYARLDGNTRECLEMELPDLTTRVFQ